MRRSTLAILCSTALASQAMTSVAIAGDLADMGKKIHAQCTDSGDQTEMMACYTKAGELGPAHQFLKDAFVGDWTVACTMWMDPSAPPMESTATSTVKTILDGRFIKETFTGNFMGQPFEGMGLTGFDNTTNQFVSTWMDSMTTGISMSKGGISADGTTLAFIGEMNEPSTGEIGKSYLVKLKVKDQNTHTMEMYEIIYGEPFKTMQMDYTRTDKRAAAN